METEKVNAIVLSCLEYGEYDIITSMFTLEHGLIRAFAKSARRSVKRFGGTLEPLNCIEATLLVRDNGLSTLKSSELSACYPSIHCRLESMALAMYGCELIEQLLPEGHPVPRLFRLFASFVDYLANNDANTSVRRFFEINLLNILGYRPEIPLPSLQTLKDCLRTGKFGSIIFNRQELRDAGKILDYSIESHIQRPLKSVRFLDEMLERTP